MSKKGGGEEEEKEEGEEEEVDGRSFAVWLRVGIQKNFLFFWISFPNVGGWGGKWLASLYNASSAVKKSTGAHKRGSSHSESQMSTDNICRISGHFTMTVDHGDSIFSP